MKTLIVIETGYCRFPRKPFKPAALFKHPCCHCLRSRISNSSDRTLRAFVSTESRLYAQPSNNVSVPKLFAVAVALQFAVPTKRGKLVVQATIVFVGFPAEVCELLYDAVDQAVFLSLSAVFLSFLACAGVRPFRPTRSEILR